MSSTRFIRRLPVVALLVLTLLTGAVPPVSPTSAHAASSTLPVTIRNTTGSSSVYLYILATDLSSDRQGYVDAKGRFHAWPAAGTTPRTAPEVAITGPRSGASTTLKLPRGLSGRLYYAVGRKLDLKLVRDVTGRTRLVQPAPWVKGDANYRTLVDWTEFTYNNGLWINSTQVDQFALPAAISVRGASGTKTTGALTSGGRAKAIKALRADSKLARSVVSDSGRTLRVISPGHSIRQGLVSAGYLDAAITRAWAAHRTKALVVRPFEDRSTRVYGRTNGSSMVFTNAAGKRVATFTKPSSVDVLECAGRLAAPNDRTVGPIARTLCAALNRGTLGSNAVEPVAKASAFYRSASNSYAKIIHSVMANKKAYAFAFDDVARQESLIHDRSPRSVTITLPKITG